MSSRLYGIKCASKLVFGYDLMLDDISYIHYREAFWRLMGHHRHYCTVGLAAAVLLTIINEIEFVKWSNTQVG